MPITRLDKLIGYFAPETAARRLAARATMQQIEAVIGSKGGYEAGKLTRLTKSEPAKNIAENEIPGGQLARMRGSSWKLYRNNPHGRKVVRQLETKTVGNGLRPQCQAVKADGKPFVEFRQRAHQVWSRVIPQLDFRGKPGRGGQHFTDLSKTAIRTVVLSGDVLARARFLSAQQQRDRGLILPLTIQLLSGELLDESMHENKDNGNQIFRGVEFGSDEQRTGYWVNGTLLPQFLAATDDVLHLYVSDDCDQVRGVPWFAPALLQLREVGDYQYNELMASAMGACVVLGYRLPSSVQKFGAQTQNTDALTDAEGNTITRLQPGMLVNLGQEGGLEPFDPARPNTNAEAFIAHMLRVTATAFPGLKGSSLTGDYRRSSFASERSADNEVWPEIEGVQHWFAGSFLQPIYELVIETAVEEGLFDGVITAGEFAERRDELLAAVWQGPVSRSINPTDDAEASDREIRNGNSSPQIEAAKRGRNSTEILQQIKEFIDTARAMELPEVFINQVLGVDSTIGPVAAEDAGMGTDPAATGEAGSNTDPRSAREEFAREVRQSREDTDIDDPDDDDTLLDEPAELEALTV